MKIKNKYDKIAGAICDTDIRLVPTDIRLVPIDVGFDVRLHNMVVNTH